MNDHNPKAFRGGRVFQDKDVQQPAQPDKPKPLRYPCFAEGCPMPGTIFLGAVLGEKAEGSGTCAWHFGVQANDIPKVTQVLRDWQCVSREIGIARRHLTGPIASDPAALDREFQAAWQRMRQAVGEWEADLKPGTIRTSKGTDTGHRQNYGDWSKHLERFLGARVVEVLSTHRRRAA